MPEQKEFGRRKPVESSQEEPFDSKIKDYEAAGDELINDWLERRKINLAQPDRIHADRVLVEKLERQVRDRYKKLEGK